MPIKLSGKRKRGLDESKRVKTRANSFVVTFFSHWFNSNNFCFPKVGITSDPKKINDSNTSVVDKDKLSTGTIEPDKANRVKADRVQVDRRDKLVKYTVNLAKVDATDANRADKPDIDTKNPAETDAADANRANKSGTSIADPAKTDKVDRSNISLLDPANLAKANGTDKSGTSTVD